MNTFYDINPFYYGYSSKDSIVKNMNPLLKDLIKKNSNKVICDIGCGCGRNLFYSCKYSKYVTGIDLSDKSLEIAKKNINCSSLKLLKGDNLNIPLKNSTADVVISDGVCHHTGDTYKAFSECIRILKPCGTLYLAVYKKFRYYPLLYIFVGGFFRLIKKYKLGDKLLEIFFVKLHYLFYVLFKKQRLSQIEVRNIFYDYFITPVATFQSKSDVNKWCLDTNSRIIKYDRTSGNCHVFLIRKND